MGHGAEGLPDFEVDGARLVRRAQDDPRPGRTVLQVVLDVPASPDLASRILDALPESRGLHYFDAGYPQVSDPGAIFTVWQVQGGLRLGYGNHGWSTPAIEVSRTDAAAHLGACLECGGRADVHLTLTEPRFTWYLEPPPLPAWRVLRRRAWRRRRENATVSFAERLAAIRADSGLAT